MIKNRKSNSNNNNNKQKKFPHPPYRFPIHGFPRENFVLKEIKKKDFPLAFSWNKLELKGFVRSILHNFS